MRLFYFVHIVGTDPGISGIPRVVRNLARCLDQNENVELVPVRWCQFRQALVHVEQELLRNLAKFDGPVLAPSPDVGLPIAGNIDANSDWLLIAEVPHLASHRRGIEPVLITEPMGYARKIGVRCALVFHDLLPLTYEDETADELTRLKFMVYAQALTNADVIFPVSRSTADALRGWLQNNGYLPERMPRIIPVLLPDEMIGLPRQHPEDTAPAGPRIEFLTAGSIGPRKNQIRTMQAFIRVAARHPELDLQLHVAGSIEENSVSSVRRLVKEAGGRIHAYGSVSDSDLAAYYRRSRASIFVSLAEGYGMPVAESLWLGKPCLCSNRGSVAEIAQAGGCLTVDPTDIGDIERGLETLATDTERYQNLLQEIRIRAFRTWPDYCEAILRELMTPRLSTPGTVSNTAIPRQAISQSEKPAAAFYVDALEFQLPPTYREGPLSLRTNGNLIAYDANIHGSAKDQVLFYGPYMDIPAGRYCLTLGGKLEGRLKILLTSNNGRHLIKELSIETFEDRISFVIPFAVRKFEIVGHKTDALQSLELESVFVEGIKQKFKIIPFLSQWLASLRRSN